VRERSSPVERQYRNKKTINSDIVAPMNRELARRYQKACLLTFAYTIDVDENKEGKIAPLVIATLQL